MEFVSKTYWISSIEKLGNMSLKHLEDHMQIKDMSVRDIADNVFKVTVGVIFGLLGMIIFFAGSIALLSAIFALLSK